MVDHKSTANMNRIMFWERAKPNPVNYFFQIPAPPTWQKHHILPCTSVKTSINVVAGQPGKDYLESALKFFTTWNINEKHNLIALPTRTSYVKAYGKRGGKQGPVLSLGNLPVHLWAHPKYNDKVDSDLQAVWSNVAITIKQHKLTSQDISAAITNIENKWKGKFPGKRLATQANWKKAAAGTDPIAHNHFTMVPVPKSPF